MNRCNASAEALRKQADLLIPLGLVGIVFVLLVPMPARLLDAVLILNLGIALSVVLLVSSVKRALELSCFPSLLLVLTMLRLSLNVASTRLILSQGAEFEGFIITAFGQSVVSGNLAIGFTIFLILVAIQFLVISKGAERVAEVAARFRLDAMPLKMMTVQSQFEGRQITAAEAEQRTEQIEREADFYGAMDGASRFVKGETLASILIFAVNLFAGVYMGFRAGVADMAPIVSAYALLTVGDGLVTLLPSLLMSLATGLLITKSSSCESVAAEAVEQICSRRKPMLAAVAIVAAMLGGLGITAGTNGVPLMAASAILLIVCWRGSRAQAESDERVVFESALRDLGFRPLELRLSPESFDALYVKGSALERELERVRHQIRAELGMQVPPIAVSSDESLQRATYSLELKGQQVASGRMPVTVPADAAGDPVESLIAAFVAKKVRQYADDLLGRQELEDLLTEVRRVAPAVYDAVGGVDRSALLAVFRGLLSEGVGIRDAVGILNAVADQKELATQPANLTEYVRQRMARQVSCCLRDKDGTMAYMTLSCELEKELQAAYVPHEDFVALPPRRAEALLRILTDACLEFEARGLRPVLVTRPELRRHVRNMFCSWLPDLSVLSPREIAREVRARPVCELAESGVASSMAA